MTGRFMTWLRSKSCFSVKGRVCALETRIARAEDVLRRNTHGAKLALKYPVSMRLPEDMCALLRRLEKGDTR